MAAKMHFVGSMFERSDVWSIHDVLYLHVHISETLTLEGHLRGEVH